MLKEKREINIVFGLNDHYVVPCCTLMVSIILNTQSCNQLHFYIAYQQLSENNRLVLLNLARHYSCQIDFIEKTIGIANTFSFDSRPDYKKKYISEETYFSLLLPSLCPDVDRILYLDCDMVCNLDIRLLYEQPLNGKLVGVVFDDPWLEYNRQYQNKVLGIPLDHKYFNAGMLLCNLPKMREANIQKQFFDTLSVVSNKIRNGDQDILNIVLYKKVKYLPVKYNCHPTFFSPRVPKSIAEEMRRIKNGHKGILHFFGPGKPWVKDEQPSWVPLHPWNSDWFKYYNFFCDFIKENGCETSNCQ